MGLAERAIVMNKKSTGLAAFGKSEPVPHEKTPDALPKKRRGQGATVALTVRVARSDWERLHQLALSQGASIQELALRGFSSVFADEGLAPMAPP